MIRTADKADIPQIAEIFKQLHKRHCDLRQDYFKMPPDSFFTDELEKKLNDESCKVTVLEHNSSIAAYAVWCLLDRNSPELTPRKRLYIDQFAVRADFRKKGLGKRLMEYLRDIAQLENCRSVDLSVWCDNTEAVTFYKSLGFSPRTVNLEIKLK